MQNTDLTGDTHADTCRCEWCDIKHAAAQEESMPEDDDTCDRCGAVGRIHVGHHARTGFDGLCDACLGALASIPAARPTRTRVTTRDRVTAHAHDHGWRRVVIMYDGAMIVYDRGDRRAWVTFDAAGRVTVAVFADGPAPQWRRVLTVRRDERDKLTRVMGAFAESA